MWLISGFSDSNENQQGPEEQDQKPLNYFKVSVQLVVFLKENVEAEI